MPSVVFYTSLFVKVCKGSCEPETPTTMWSLAKPGQLTAACPGLRRAMKAVKLSDRRLQTSGQRFYPLAHFFRVSADELSAACSQQPHTPSISRPGRRRTQHNATQHNTTPPTTELKTVAVGRHLNGAPRRPHVPGWTETPRARSSLSAERNRCYHQRANASLRCGRWLRTNSRAADPRTPRGAAAGAARGPHKHVPAAPVR